VAAGGTLDGSATSRTTEETTHHEEPAMFTNPHVMLNLHATRAHDLHAEAARYRLVRALERHASTTGIDRVGPRRRSCR
jgi:hypothetical protein